MNRMRILFVSAYALPHLGGVEVVIDNLARELQSRGHEVTQIAAAGGDVPATHRVLRVPAWNIVERAGVPYPFFGPALWRTCAEEIAKSDVVHVHGMLYQPSIIAMSMAARRAHPCRVLTEHVGHVAYSNPVVDAVERAAIATAGRRTARTAHAIIVLNSRVDGEMQALAPGVPRATIPNGVDLARFRPPEPGERERLRAELGWDAKPRVLFVGRMVEKKGLREALAGAALANGAFELVLAGRGAVRDLPPAARYFGELPPPRIAELYRAADAFLLPSRGEGFPLTAQEAMASGLPIILADDPAYRGMLDGAGRAATLVAPDPEAIVGAINAVLASPELGAEASAFARRRFSWAKTVDEHLALYSRIFGSAR